MMNATGNSLSLVVGGSSISNARTATLPPITSAKVKKAKEIKQICGGKAIADANGRSVFGNGSQKEPLKELLDLGTPSTPSTPFNKRKPTGMSRAHSWSMEVENAFRFQEAGFVDLSEYTELGNDVPEVWPSGFVKCLKAKKTGFFLYFRAHRECLDKYLNKVKLYTY